MDDAQSRRRAARLEAALASGELEPPWSKYPWIIRGSIGWRMGIGESYQILWGDFVRQNLTDKAATIAYLQRHPPAPRTWRDTLVRWLARFDDGATDDDDDDDDDDNESPAHAALLAQIEAAGLVGDDVAYPVFLRNALREGGMTVPWTWPGSDDPAAAWRYSTREVGWWARWLATECADRAAWLAAQPAPPAPWATVVAAVRAGTADVSWATLDGGAARLIPATVAHAALPPPWLGGHPPSDEIEWHENADDRDRWAWWVHDTFEDATSWRAYLERWPPPPAWQAALAENLFSYLM